MLLDGLDDDQRAVALATHGPVVVYAGAGAGKTRAITHRIAHAVASGDHDPTRSLAVTFTAKAAGELRGRLAALGAPGVVASTFHAAALRQLRHFWPQVVGGEAWAILPSKARLVAEAAARVGVSGGSALLRDLAADIEWAKVRELTPETFGLAVAAAGRSTAADVPDVLDVWRSYEDLKHQRAVIDFEDVLLLTVGMLVDRPDVASAVRARYHWFTVDEFQDVNPVQFHLLRLWLGDGDDVCVVGDAAQTIYTFAGADPRYLREFRTHWSNATVINLARTYRCTPEIAGVANRVLVSSGHALQLQSQRPSGPAPEVRAFDDEEDEANGVASLIAEWVGAGVPLRDIAVLYRTNAQSEAFEQALSSRGIAYSIRGSERFFDRAEIRRAITLLRGQALAQPGAEVVPAVRDVLAGLGWSSASPSGGAAARELWEAQQALFTLAGDIVAAKPDASLADLVAELDRRAEQQHAPVADGITLASLHAAKGLEWSRVCIVGCSEGLLPLALAEGLEAVEEERRLFYVGVTRAADVLVCTYARARSANTRGTRQPSRFLASFDQPLLTQRTGGGSVQYGRPKRERVRTGPARCRECGTALVTGVERTLGRCTGCPGDADEALYARLVEWRLNESKSRSVPAFVVFTDATLRAVAEQRPRDAAGLLRISGIGTKKLDEYGTALLALLNE